jgi:nicotinate-nucleotide adenylyltransferase
MNKIGIMGGTFNPIHTAHLILAEEAYEQLGLDKILFMPSKKPPHKLNDEIVSNEHRLNMIHLSIEDNKHFELSTLELEREGITYTSDTLRELTKLSCENEYYFIVGGDSLFMIESWWEPEVIFALCHIVVAIRGEAKEDLRQKITYLSEKYNASIHLLKTPNLEISSHELRLSRNENKSIRYYVPELVNKYILDNGLYLNQ